MAQAARTWRLQKSSNRRRTAPSTRMPKTEIESHHFCTPALTRHGTSSIVPSHLLRGPMNQKALRREGAELDSLPPTAAPLDSAGSACRGAKRERKNPLSGVEQWRLSLECPGAATTWAVVQHETVYQQPLMGLLKSSAAGRESI